AENEDNQDTQGDPRVCIRSSPVRHKPRKGEKHEREKEYLQKIIRSCINCPSWSMYKHHQREDDGNDNPIVERWRSPRARHYCCNKQHQPNYFKQDVQDRYLGPPHPPSPPARSRETCPRAVPSLIQRRPCGPYG